MVHTYIKKQACKEYITIHRETAVSVVKGRSKMWFQDRE